MIGIYKITSPSGKIYIGSSINIEKRLKYYKSLNCKKQIKLYNSLKKYGYEFHKIEIIEECSKDNLYQREFYYGHFFNVLNEKGLNSILPKLNSCKIGVSDETKLKMSNSKIGIKNTFYGKTHTKETIEKIKNFQTGRKHTIEHRNKVSMNNAKNKSKIILDLSNGVFYSSAKELSDLYEIKHSTLRSILNGTNRNKTSFIYC